MRAESFSAGGRALWLSAVTLLGVGSTASGQDVGYRGPSLLGAGPTTLTALPSVTESKPESKVWYNDNFWWSSMWSASALEFRIHRLNMATHAWVDSGVTVDARADSHSDALWDGTKLYIASHEFATGVGMPGRQLLLMRYSYAPTTDTYSLDTDFPVVIGDSRTEAMVIDKDSTGKIWAVWKQYARVYYAHSTSSDILWTKPAVLPPCTSNFNSDDICSVVRFGNRIGVMWSDQVLTNFFFTSHLDGAPDTDWSTVEVALAGEADDHLHLEADAAGKVYAVVKNLANQTKLLVRSTTGVWQQYLVCDKGLNVTRGTMLLDEPAKKVHVFYTVGPSAQGGGIYKKTSALDNIVFDPTSIGTLIMQDGSGMLINNASTTKQNVTAAMGQVIVSANTTQSGNYWHHEVPPVPTSGTLVLNAPSPGTAGVVNTFTVTGAPANTNVVFYAGLTQGTSVITRLSCPLGITIGIKPFIQIGSARANASGVATLSLTPAASTAGKLYYFQATAPAACRASNLVSDQL